LLGNDRERSSYTTAVTDKRFHVCTATKEWCFLCGTCRDVISRTVSESQLRVDSWSNELVVRQSPAGKNVSKEAEGTVGIRPQATTGGDSKLGRL
jgi:hypothetical protein